MRVKDQFPVFKHKKETPPIIETFPASPQVRNLHLTNAPLTERGEFFADDESRMIAIQGNRFSFHWKDRDGDYPSYDVNGKVWSSEFDRFKTFCKELEIGEVNPLICEVMYMNKIVALADESLDSTFERVFGLSVGKFELATLNRTYLLNEDRGRLYAEINTIPIVDDPHLTLKLSARVRHEEGEVADTMQIAHDWLIKKFLDLTSDEARSSWT